MMDRSSVGDDRLVLLSACQRLLFEAIIRGLVELRARIGLMARLDLLTFCLLPAVITRHLAIVCKFVKNILEIKIDVLERLSFPIYY